VVPESPPPKKRSRWLIAIAALATAIVVLAVAAVLVAFFWFDVSLNDGVGDRTYRPTSTGDVRDEYKLGVGSLKLDLSRVPADAELHVEARVGIGDLRVIVPSGAAVSVDARAKVGSVSVLGRDDDGRNARVRLSNGSTLVLDAHVGAGNVDVERGG
jgi:Cell wall-active antibiotics response 4TMS YvqF